MKHPEFKGVQVFINGQNRSSNNQFYNMKHPLRILSYATFQLHSFPLCNKPLSWKAFLPDAPFSLSYIKINSYDFWYNDHHFALTMKMVIVIILVYTWSEYHSEVTTAFLLWVSNLTPPNGGHSCFLQC